MKNLWKPLVAVAVCGMVATALMSSVEADTRNKPSSSTRVMKTVRGEVFFLERIALMPGAKLHVSLVGRIAGAEYLPLATTVIAARNGITPFELKVPADAVPAGPYRVQAWIIADNRAMFIGAAPQTMLSSLNQKVRIRLRMASAPQNIDGIGDGQPLPIPNLATLRGSVSKRDRRALLPSAVLKIELRDTSRADAVAPLLSRKTIELKGRQFPTQFKLLVEPSALKPKMRYSLSAQLFENGKLSYRTDSVVSVTRENLDGDFELRLKSAR